MSPRKARIRKVFPRTVCVPGSILPRNGQRRSTKSGRRFRDYFYVENMHGYDWEALRDQYRPLLEHVAHRSDLNYLMGEMIGELNISHAYVSGGDEGLPERHPIALLGGALRHSERPLSGQPHSSRSE